CIEEMRNRARQCVAALDAALAGREFLVGDAFSGADIMTAHSLRGFGRHCPGDVIPGNVASFIARMGERKGYQATEAADKASKVG
ncbi:MAG: glutathione S-transferase family protein, partial [Chromatiales bacterium]|nr:glutathione S-transferase family protein [Chromatiales bacterium]